MVRSMICNSQLPNYLWGKAIRASNYFLNRVPSYPEKTKGYKFYCPNHTTRLVETGRAVFLENVHEKRKATDFVFEELFELAIELAKQSVQVPHISEIQGEDYEDMEPEQEHGNEIQV
ncbi:hypothetical protein L3X38_033214 [Prunus dulcis]|uniref:Transposable element protein n=1 Tax=Prunus dulcis TaxID=3755 RepID=A0AAD4YWL7_PRUDU|nr:hypothetical protein L3X38_033214 [Prunus dulcis]